MKFAAVTLLFAALALASPAPVAEPEAAAAPAPVAQLEAESAQLNEALAARVAAPAPELAARAAGITLDSRDPKKGGGKKGGSNGNETEDAAISMTPSRALQLGALGLGVMEVVRLWG